MNRTTTRVAVGVVGLGLLLAGVAGGYWWARRSAEDAAAQAVASASRAERKILYWYDPMAPEHHFDRPGKSPLMDMDLVPRYADEVAGGGVGIDAGLQQSVGIRTGLVEVGHLETQLRVPATLTWNLRKESIVSTPVSAIASRVFVKAPFETVRRGQPLVTVLAPEWSSAIAEAAAVEQAQSPEARALQGAARQRLRILGIPGARAQGGGVTLPAPHDGVVSEVLVREGQAIAPGTPLFRVNGIDTLWLEASIPQAGSAGIVSGSRVEATVSAVPGRTFEGEVEALLPQIDAGSRTQRARIELRNEDGLLVPGMFAQLTLRGGVERAVPLIPTEALIATGNDSRVIVVDKDGRFRPVRVQVGTSSGGRTEVLSGLKGGERVVTSGQFLIDSEASLSGALERLGAADEAGQGAAQTTSHENGPATPAPAAAAAGTGHDHAAAPTPAPVTRPDHDHGTPAPDSPTPPPPEASSEPRMEHDHGAAGHSMPPKREAPEPDTVAPAEEHNHGQEHRP